MDLKITRINEKIKWQKYTQNDSTYVHFKILCIGERHTQMWGKIKTDRKAICQPEDHSGLWAEEKVMR